MIHPTRCRPCNSSNDGPDKSDDYEASRIESGQTAKKAGRYSWPQPVDGAVGLQTYAEKGRDDHPAASQCGRDENLRRGKIALVKSDRTLASHVFINCPFDPEYEAIFRALLFAILILGFKPRSSKEFDDGGQMRMEKLYDIIRDCRYGIHDISRTELHPDSGLPRFNMPFELGVFFGAKRLGSEGQHAKRALVLDIERYRYPQFISDIAGSDIHPHGNDPAVALRVVRDWLANVSRRDLPSANLIEKLYRRFIGDLPRLAAELEHDPASIPYVDFEKMIIGWLLNAVPGNPEAVG